MEYFWKKKIVVSYMLSLLVVFIHSTAIDQYVMQLDYSPFWNDFGIAIDLLFSETISRIAVPLFFIISGACFFRDYKANMYLQKMHSRLYTILIPFLIWNVLAMIFNIICSYTPIHNLYVRRELFVLNFKNIFDSILFYKCNYVFWFIFDLIIFFALTPVFDILTTKKWMTYTFIVITFFLPIYCDEYLSNLYISSNSIVYYSIGILIGKYYFDSFTKRKDKKIIIFSVFFSILCLILQIIELFGNIIFPYICKQTIIIVFCFSFWNSIDAFCNKIKIKDKMSNTFFIYAMHSDVQMIIVKIIYLLGPKQVWMAVPNFFISYILTITSINLVASMIKKISPKIFLLLSGGRSLIIEKNTKG